MKIKTNRISNSRKENKRRVIQSCNIVPQNSTSINCHASEYVSVEVVVEGQSYNIEISNKKINEVFVNAFPNL